MSKELVNKAKLIYYLNSHGRKYFDKPYSYHLTMMVEKLKMFGYNDPEFECGVWLYNARCPKKELINDFGERVFNMIENTSNDYKFAKSNKDAVILLLADRIHHIDFFIENGMRTHYDSFYKHHKLFKTLQVKGQCDTMWTYLNAIMNKDWTNMMCI